MRRVWIGVFILSLVINFVLLSQDNPKKQPTSDLSNNRYPFLSPRIFAENQNDLLINFVPLREKLSLATNTINHKIGIYFEYLPTGTSIGIHEKDAFVPASLLKTPLAMGVFKNYERKQLDPEDTLTVTSGEHDDRFGKLWQLKPGTILTVQQSLKYLLKYSDNTAQNMLLTKVQIDEVDHVFEALDIPMVRNDDGRSTVTPKNYSSIFRCLYLSCYLTKDHSNELLMLLTETIFKDKLQAPIPKQIPVAHKIGVYSSILQPDKNVYTDCGIIYQPKRPYILCVMTESDETSAQVNISLISKLVFDYVNAL